MRELLNTLGAMAAMTVCLMAAKAPGQAPLGLDGGPAASDPVAVGRMTPYQRREVFRQANSLYEAKDYAVAAELYSALLDAGLDDPTLLYNAGSAYAALGETGLAVWHFERAKRQAPRDPDIQRNLNLTAPPENDPPVFVLWRPFRLFNDLFSLEEAALAMAGGWWIGLLCLSLAALVRKTPPRRFARTFAVVGLCFFIVFGAVSLAKAINQHGRNWAVVVAPNIISRAAPRDNSEDEYELPGGLRVLAGKTHPGGWIEARLLDGRRTFVREEQLRRL